MNRQQQIDVFVAQAHVLATERLRQSPTRLTEVRAQLARWRAIAGPNRSDVYWDEWQNLLDGPLDQLAMSVCADTDHASVLRSVSPMSVLITQAERSALLKQARRPS